MKTHDPAFIRLRNELLNLRYVKRISLKEGHLEITHDEGESEVTQYMAQDAEATFRAIQKYCVNQG
jgi:hypothetical protein